MTTLHPVEQLIQDGLNQFNRSIHEIIHPAIDAFWLDQNILVKVDLAGFTGKDVKVELAHNFLIISAKRDSIKKVMKDNNQEIDVIYEHRPLKVHARIPLPFLPKEDKDEVQPGISEVTIVNGVLTVKITNLPKNKVHCPK